eukprot:1162179-Amphidinium_carterae.1
MLSGADLRAVDCFCWCTLQSTSWHSRSKVLGLGIPLIMLVSHKKEQSHQEVRGVKTFLTGPLPVSGVGVNAALRREHMKAGHAAKDLAIFKADDTVQ